MEGIRLYPNPFENKINLQWQNHRPELVEIYTLNGQLLHRSKISNSNEQIQEIAFKAPSGIYFVYFNVKGVYYYKKINRK